MNTKICIASIGATALAVLLGCSTPQPDAAVTAVSAESPPPPMLSYSIPLERPAPPLEPLPAFCKLGTSCLALDPRPFEACLLSTKDCRDKATEPLLVAQPELIAPPAVIKTGE